MDRLEGNGKVEKERVENIRGDGQRGIGYTHVSNVIRATRIDHVINHGLSLREAGQSSAQYINRSTVASIIRTFQRENR